MRITVKSRLTLLLTILMLVVNSSGHSQSSGLIDVTIQRVIDGDTVVLSSGMKLRYIGINAPDIEGMGWPAESYSQEALEFNKKLVEGKDAKIELDKQLSDSYNRILAYVYLKDGTFVNAELVKLGYARVVTYPPNVKYSELFLKLEKEARDAKLGIWIDYDDTQPYNPDFVKFQEVLIDKVVDGDTVILNTGEKLRYIGVNAPEILPDRPLQYFGKEAYEFNKSLVENKRVLLEFDKRLRDDYDRILAYIYLKNNKFINAELLLKGYARFSDSEQNVKHNNQLTKLEQEAKSAGLGLWSIPKWDVNKDGSIDDKDMSILIQNYGKRKFARINLDIASIESDIDGDGITSIVDIVIFLKYLGKTYPEPAYIEPKHEQTRLVAGVNDNIIVYITEAGDKYHRDSCQYLVYSKIPITVREAKERGYTPCLVCKPPE